MRRIVTANMEGIREYTDYAVQVEDSAAVRWDTDRQEAGIVAKVRHLR
jgi:hypothetical protein